MNYDEKGWYVVKGKATVESELSRIASALERIALELRKQNQRDEAGHYIDDYDKIPF